MHPARWSNDDMTELERQLLEAARSDRVPQALSARMAQGLPLDLATLAGGATAAAAGVDGAAAAKVGLSLLAKAGLWGTLSLGLVAATAGWYALRTAPAQQPGAPAALAAQPSRQLAAETPVRPPRPGEVGEAGAVGAVGDIGDIGDVGAVRDVGDIARPGEPRGPGLREPAAHGDLAVPPPPAQVAQMAQVAQVVPDDGALRAEVALLASVRTALQRRATARALQLLDRHHVRFPAGTLVPEAAALRIEALIQQGSRELAAAQTRQFVQAYPTHPLRKNVASLVETHKDATPAR